MTIELSELPETVTGYLVKRNEVVVCDRCKGLGTYTTEELGDYHKREYYTERHVCKNCKGDGRIVIQHEYLQFHTNEKTTKTPFNEFKGDPYYNDSLWFRHKLDRRDRALENAFPELAAITYSEYDKLAEKCRTIAALKKEII